MNVICIIPARGNSKRLPNKNIVLLKGKPLIAYSIDAWYKSKYNQGMGLPVVSTDSDDIGRVARQYRATVINRPAALAQDDTPTVEVIRHVVEYYKKLGVRLQWILILQPTSPLRTAEDIDACLDVVARNEADSVTSISDNSKYDTQENGAIYITHANLIEQGLLYGQRLYKYKMPPERSIDIDTAEDLAEAERILKEEKLDNSGVLRKSQGRHGNSPKDDSRGKRGGRKSR